MILYLEQCTSTNQWAKEHSEKLCPFGAVYTMDQTQGRGRLGRQWENAAGKALYYTVAHTRPMCQPEAQPLLMSLVVQDALHQQFGVDCQIKWPNDILLNGCKLAGILCESTVTPAGQLWVLGVGVNLAQPQSYFTGQGLPYAGSLAMAGVPVQPEQAAHELAVRITALLEQRMADFCAEGFAPLRKDYCAACVNLGRHITWQKDGATVGGTCRDVDNDGHLMVESDAGKQEIFTGEVSVQGIYGSL